jgi:hypothetical protein
MPQMLGPIEVVGGGPSPGTDPAVFNATCDAGVAVGTFVRLTGNAGPEVEAADAYLQAKIPSVGIVVSKTSPTVCVVRNLGAVALFVGLTPGKVYWLGADGAIQATPPPAAPGTMRYAQIVGYALDGSTLMVDINQVVHGFNS